jgi:Tfp pilus assembly protein PilF
VANAADACRRESEPRGQDTDQFQGVSAKLPVHRFGAGDNAEALLLFGKATDLDPDYAAAYAMGARCYL